MKCEIFEMADRRDWGGGGDDPEESTQHMIERIWESLTDIRARMDQQAPVPPVAVPPWDGEAIPVALVPPRVEVPFVAPVPPPPLVLIAEEPVILWFGIPCEASTRSREADSDQGTPKKDPEVYWKGKERVRHRRRVPLMGLEVKTGHPILGCLQQSRGAGEQKASHPGSPW
ncbi:hypothetical protein Taro_006355 [Colocasia esculenta]|uniref:Uncharacterized protein n=1 Tax=Colocasia esculenta TaxID=4460 RepID=A0A843TX58_COLES|nr:hypothetical protein [Colocasia esculenta]